MLLLFIKIGGVSVTVTQVITDMESGAEIAGMWRYWHLKIMRKSLMKFSVSVCPPSTFLSSSFVSPKAKRIAAAGIST